MPHLTINPDAKRNYEILDEFEAGIRLGGAEVKSVKAGHVSLRGAYATMHDGRLWLRNCHVSPYRHAPQNAFDPTRERELLVHKKELASLIGKLQTEGLTLLPLSVYTHRGLVKVRLGLGRGLKKHDKRERLKKRETARAIERAMRQKH